MLVLLSSTLMTNRTKYISLNTEDFYIYKLKQQQRKHNILTRRNDLPFILCENVNVETNLSAATSILLYVYRYFKTRFASGATSNLSLEPLRYWAHLNASEMMSLS